MDFISSFEILIKNILNKYNSLESNALLLIGGCSRSGKTTLSKKIAHQLNKNDINSIVVNIDSWIISIEKRKIDSKVMDRFECNEIIKSINLLLNEEKVYPPIYDPITRTRSAEKNADYYYLEKGVLIVEGVIVIALKELLEKSLYSIFVDISDEKRLKRLYDFYRKVKGLSERQTNNIILSREKEEVLFIKKHSKNASCIYNLDIDNNRENI